MNLGNGKSASFHGAISGALHGAGLLPCSSVKRDAELAKQIRKSGSKPQPKWVYWKRHRDDREMFDSIELDTVPRYKTSDLSGDEWRVSTAVKFLYKGRVLYKKHYNRMDDALKHLPWLMRTINEKDPEEDDGFTEDGKKAWKEGFYAGKPEFCFQPGCSNPPTHVVRLKKEYCEHGHGHESEFHEFRRAFCDKHKVRGDCGLEDRDSNYEPIESPPAGG